MTISEEHVDSVFDIFEKFEAELDNYHADNDKEAKQNPLLACLLTIAYFLPLD